MKKIFALCTLTLILGAAWLWRASAAPARFGEFTSAPRAQISNVIADPKAYQDRTVELEGAISEQCRTMGCYFFFHSSDDSKATLRVDLQQIAMTAPMREGRRVRVEGHTMPYQDGYQFVASAVEFH